MNFSCAVILVASNSCWQIVSQALYVSIGFLEIFMKVCYDLYMIFFSVVKGSPSC